MQRGRAIMNLRRSTSLLDRVGAGLSGLCVAHCLALPLVAAALPSLATLAEAKWIHIVVFLAAMPTAIVALLRPGNRLAPSPSIATAGLMGLTLLAVGAFGPAAGRELASIAGGVALSSAHVLNWRRRLSSAQAARCRTPVEADVLKVAKGRKRNKSRRPSSGVNFCAPGGTGPFATLVCRA